MEDQKTSYGQVALKFSTALLNGQFEEAHALLSASIREEWTPSLLQETYEEMVEYFEIPQMNYQWIQLTLKCLVLRPIVLGFTSQLLEKGTARL